MSDITGARRAPAQGDYTHCHSQVANTVHLNWLPTVDCQRDRQFRVTNTSHSQCFELATNCRLSKGPPIPCYKHEPQQVFWIGYQLSTVKGTANSVLQTWATASVLNWLPTVDCQRDRQFRVTIMSHSQCFELATNCRLSKGPPIPCYNHDPQPVFCELQR